MFLEYGKDWGLEYNCYYCNWVSGYFLEKKKKKELQTEYIKKAIKQENEGKRILIENSEILSFLPSDYWYPMATEYLIKVVNAKRVQSLSEALDMYDLYYHRWKVENTNVKMLENQQSQMNYLNAIQKENEKNATANEKMQQLI